MGLVNASTRSGSASIITRRASRVVAPDPLRHSTDKSNRPLPTVSLSLLRGDPSLSVHDTSHGGALVHPEDLRRDQPPLHRRFLDPGTESRPSLAQYQLGQTSPFSTRLFYLFLHRTRARRIRDSSLTTDTDGRSGAPDRKIPSLSAVPVSPEVVASSWQIDRSPIHIPTEIIDQIVDYFHADKSCLRNCALVCKSWTFSCRRHIFYRVVLEYRSWSLSTWNRTISATANGPHLHTRELKVDVRHFEGIYRQSSNIITPFLQHWFLFVNVRDLVVTGSVDENTLDKISIHNIFGHLSGTLRSLSILATRCSPQALISLIASFQHLERLDLKWISFESSQLPHPLHQSHVFKGFFHFWDWNHSSEKFVTLLSKHDLQYREMRVSGAYWLQNIGLAKCADHLEELSLVWTRGSSKHGP